MNTWEIRWNSRRIITIIVFLVALGCFALYVYGRMRYDIAMFYALRIMSGVDRERCGAYQGQFEPLGHVYEGCVHDADMYYDVTHFDAQPTVTLFVFTRKDDVTLLRALSMPPRFAVVVDATRQVSLFLGDRVGVGAVCADAATSATEKSETAGQVNH